MGNLKIEFSPDGVILSNDFVTNLDRELTQIWQIRRGQKALGKLVENKRSKRKALEIALENVDSNRNKR